MNIENHFHYTITVCKVYGLEGLVFHFISVSFLRDHRECLLTAAKSDTKCAHIGIVCIQAESNSDVRFNEEAAISFKNTQETPPYRAIHCKASSLVRLAHLRNCSCA